MTFLWSGWGEARGAQGSHAERYLAPAPPQQGLWYIKSHILIQDG